MSEAIVKPKGKGSLAEALVAAQAEMPKVEKRGKNPHFKNEYVTLDDLLEAVRPVLNRHGLAVVQFPDTMDGKPALTTVLWHGPSGDKTGATMPLILQKEDMQGVGAAITYARRYMLAAALGIAEGTDDDGNQASAGSRDRGDYVPPVRVEPRAKRPESWAELAAGFDALEVDPEWLKEATFATFLKDTKDLDSKEKDLAFQALASVLMQLQDGVYGQQEMFGFSREQLQQAFASMTAGVIVEGPPWAVGMEKPPDRLSRKDWEAKREAELQEGEDPSIEFGEPVRS